MNRKNFLTNILKTIALAPLAAGAEFVPEKKDKINSYDTSETDKFMAERMSQLAESDYRANFGIIVPQGLENIGDLRKKHEIQKIEVDGYTFVTKKYKSWKL